MDHFAPMVISVKYYLRVNHEKRPKEWLLSSGEAFTMMENYLETANAIVTSPDLPQLSGIWNIQTRYRRENGKYAHRERS